jgi:NAD-dependent deacetylase
VDEAIRTALQALRDELRPGLPVAVLTGAGISAASGIPTFRGAADSLWENHRPEELATPGAFARDPELVWRWYDWRRETIAAAEPNAAHRALARLAETVAMTLVTQNVDGLHQRAGSRGVLEFHGSIWRLRCTGCGREGEDRRVPLPIPPRCEACGGLLRPGVVWFGEGIDPAVMSGAAAAARDCALFLVVGTSGAVYPAAGLAAVARDSGARVLEFNLVPSALSDRVDLFVPGDAAETLPFLLP